MQKAIGADERPFYDKASPGEAARKPTFRNPDGAAFKVQNLRSGETGKGLGNVSRMDREIWDEFGANPVEVSRLASLCCVPSATESCTA